MDWIFILFSTLLLLCHYTFFFRAFLNRKRDFKPQKLDKVSKLLASSLLLPTAISGLFSDTVSILKVIPWLPIVVIIFFAFRREIVKQNPYLLTIINGVLITLSFILSLGNMI